MSGKKYLSSNFRSNRSVLFLSIIFLTALLFSAPAHSATKKSITFDSRAFGGFKARMVGPAVMSGRITAIQVSPQDYRVMYVGTAGGGIWKSRNGGTTFQQVFKKHTMAIGSLAIDPANPDTVWAGTGECNVRNSVSVGTGIYVSKDGGRNWTFKGLKDSERISKIIVHPKDPKTIYAAVLGHLWNGNQERGVFKSTDEGKTWKKILYVDSGTGCADLDMDPQEPEVLYASMWQFRRYPWFFTSGGKGSGLHKSIDGGKTWNKIHKGFPKGDLGRIALAISPTRPGTLYALVEAKKTGLYLSNDMGASWKRVNESTAVGIRPFYFSVLEIDPQDYKRIYTPSVIMFSSKDGGKTFNFAMGAFHPDLHALWINPKDPRHLVLGSDGGIYISWDRGSTFSHAASIPVSQFYHVSYDLENPYNVYGGLQDNGSWYGPSRSYAAMGIQNHHWKSIGVGDGFYIIRHPADKDIIYYSWQGGKFVRVNERTRESKDIQPLPSKKSDPVYRFHWDAAFALSPTDPETIYAGAQFLFKSVNRGDTWQRISPDLTTNDPKKQQQQKSGGLTIDNTSAENHCTIVSIAESPKDKNLIWVGTDDGNVQVTRDGGKTWQNVVKNIPGLPAFTWCTHIEPSRFDAGTAYAVFDGHMTGDMKPYVYKTHDFGKTWTSLITPVLEGYCHVIVQDLINKDLLFLGTEFGLFVSIDGGGQWAHLSNVLPKVAVRDIKIHPSQNDLILGTHGLGILIIDDITCFRDLTPDVLNAPAAVLTSRPSVLETPSITQEFPGNSGFFGENPSGGAAITYYLKKRHIFGSMKLEVLDESGKVIKTLPTGKSRGLNRVHWNMRLKRPKVARAAGLNFSVDAGPMVPEGTYTVRLVKGKQTYTGKIKLIPNPVSAHPKADRKLRQETVWKLYHMQADLAFVADNVQGLMDQIKKILKNKVNKKAKSTLENFKKKLETYHQSIVQHKGIMSGEKLRAKVMGLYSSVIQYGGKPSDSQLYYLSVLKEKISEAESRYKTLTAQLSGVNKVLNARKISTLTLMTRQEYDKKL